MTKNIVTIAEGSDLELVTISFRVYKIHRDLIEQAAAKVEGRTISDYVRETTTIRAAADCGVMLPQVPEIVRGRHGSLVAQAANRLGMTRAEFEAKAIQMAAEQALQQNAVDEQTPAPQHRSTMRPTARSGLYSSTPTQPMRKTGTGK